MQKKSYGFWKINECIRYGKVIDWLIIYWTIIIFINLQLSKTIVN